MSLPKHPFPPDVDPGPVPDDPDGARLPIPLGEPFDLALTLRSGQAFGWSEQDGEWLGVHRGCGLRLRQEPEAIVVRASGTITTRELWSLLGLGFPARAARARLAADPALAAGLGLWAGMRLLRQDPWECLLGFVCSQNSNIPKIERSLDRLGRGWGRQIRWPDGPSHWSLPRPEELAGRDPLELSSTGLGYRARYLPCLAGAVLDLHPCLDDLRTSDQALAAATLLALPGVGRKVADCVLLFALDHPAAFPVDVWIRRAMHAQYREALSRELPDLDRRAAGSLTTREYQAISDLAAQQWGELAGYAQQLLFHTWRMGLSPLPVNPN